MQAMEAIKYLTGTGEVLTNKLIILEGETMSFHEIRIQKNPECKVCGTY
jgi:molybdopterin/thiamine biosynthesis adenylyltransferase